MFTAAAPPRRRLRRLREAVRDVRAQQPVDLLAGNLRMPDPKVIVLVEDKSHLAED